MGYLPYQQVSLPDFWTINSMGFQFATRISLLTSRGYQGFSFRSNWVFPTVQVLPCASCHQFIGSEVLFFSGWWFHPLWKICSSKWESSPNKGKNKKIFETTNQYLFLSLDFKITKNLGFFQKFNLPRIFIGKPEVSNERQVLSFKWFKWVISVLFPIKLKTFWRSIRFAHDFD